MGVSACRTPVGADSDREGEEGPGIAVDMVAEAFLCRGIAKDMATIATAHEPKLGAVGTGDGFGTLCEHLLHLARGLGLHQVAIAGAKGLVGTTLYKALKSLYHEELWDSGFPATISNRQAAGWTARWFFLGGGGTTMSPASPNTA